MVELRERSKYIQIVLLPAAKTKVNIIERNCKCLVQAAQLVINALFHHQARAGHRAHVLRVAKTPHVAQILAPLPVMHMPCRPVRAKADHDSRVLDCLVRIIELAADAGNIVSLRVHQKFLDPVERNHFRVIVQKQDIFPARF